MSLFRKKIVLALGGGAARGLSNIGVLKVLEGHFGREKMPFDMIVGTSIGSLIGAAYCSGVPVGELERMALEFNWPGLLDFTLDPTGLIKGGKLEDIIKNMIGDKTFEGLKVPFALTTTDIQSGEELIHYSGDLIKLIRASCSWPGFFSSVEIDGRLLGDGGIRNSIPTKFAYRLGATFVLAVNPGFAVSEKGIDNAFKALIQSIQIMGEELNYYQSKAADVAVDVEMHDVDQFDFDKSAYIIKAGELAAQRMIREIGRKLFLHRMLGI